MVYEADTGLRRWLLKAIRESTGELYSHFSGLSDEHLRWRPATDEWCLKEVAAHLRDAEVLYQRQIEAIVNEQEPHLPHEPIDVLPFERNYRDLPLMDLLRDHEAAREETVWLLRMIGEDDWQRTGIHPYRGRITIADLVHDLHQHDLEHLYQARKLRTAIEISRGRTWER
jgi:hypothetical protein